MSKPSELEIAKRGYRSAKYAEVQESRQPYLDTSNGRRCVECSRVRDASLFQCRERTCCLCIVSCRHRHEVVGMVKRREA